MENDKTENSAASHCYAAIDLVVTKDEKGQYHATGGPREAMFGGDGRSSDEAIGSWFRQNREAVNFQVSFVKDGEFQSSTRYGVGRSKEELGPNELKALKELERHKSAMKLQRWDMVADYSMQQREDGDWCEATDVEPLEDVAKLILISPITGDRLEVMTDLKTEGPFAVFQVGNRRESFEVRISMEEV